MRRNAVVLLVLLLAVEIVMTAVESAGANRKSGEIESALREKTEMLASIENGKKTVTELESELTELEQRYAWAREMYEIWVREDREIKELIGS
jgi:archaellum component FlaC